MLEVIGLIAGVLAAGSYYPYILDILHKKAKPERASWLIWSILVGIAFFAQLSEGATSSLWFSALDGLGALLVFLLSLKYGAGGLVRRDLNALIAAGIGLVIWYFTKEAVFALLITMGIDAIAASLTVMKTYEDPSTETYPMWLIVSLAGILAIISVGELDPILLAYPFYIFLANFSVAVSKYLGEHKKQ
ncbi:MAG: hypothetical protein WCO52_00770 [bacterium]